MSEHSPIPEPPEWLKGLSRHDLSELPPRDYIYGIADDFDFEAQLRAIHGLLRRNREAEKAHATEIEQADENARKLTGILREYAVDCHIELIHASFYQDAAHSMAAVGMLAPFIETMFTKCFQGIGRRWPIANTPADSNARWHAAQTIQWDCHNVIENGRIRADLVKGILQLADAIGLRSRLPAEIDKTLAALFGYRNKMFHCGFEWAKDERVKFQNRIEYEQWPGSWFASATTDGEPLIFYMSEEFIEHCLTTIDSVLTAFGEFARDMLTSDKGTVR